MASALDVKNEIDILFKKRSSLPLKVFSSTSTPKGNFKIRIVHLSIDANIYLTVLKGS